MQHMLDTWNIKLVFNLIFLGIEISFVIVAVELTLAQIEFYLVMFFALILLPFIAWEPLRFIGMRTISAVISQAIKLGIILAVISLGMYVLNSVTKDLLNSPDIAQALNQQGPDFSIVGEIFAACAVLTFLCLQIPALACLLCRHTGFSAAASVRT